MGGGNAGGWGMQGRRDKGEKKNWYNCNNIINKIYFKKRNIIGEQNRQAEVKNNIANGEAKELTCTTHGHELSEEIARGKGEIGQMGKGGLGGMGQL